MQKARNDVIRGISLQIIIIFHWYSINLNSKSASSDKI